MQILYSPATPIVQGRRLLQDSAPAVDLTNATTVSDIMGIALEMAEASGDSATVDAINSGLDQADLSAVSTAVANLNEATEQATDLTSTQLSTMYAEDYVSPPSLLVFDCLMRGFFKHLSFLSSPI